MMFGPFTDGKLHNVTTHNLIWANQKSDFSVYHWLRANAMFELTGFPAFVRASDVNSSLLSVG